MGRRRSTLVGAIVLGLLAGLPAMTVAQSEEPAGQLDWTASTTFSGTSSCTVVGFGERTEEEIIRQRGFTSECTEEMSDPRVSGVSTTTWDQDCYPSIACVSWGTFELAGPDGTWVGTFTGTGAHGEQSASLGMGIGRGTGAYEGWVYIVHTSSPDPYLQTNVEGVIYLGDPPAIEVTVPVE
jgi:hypothetical protein